MKKIVISLVAAVLLVGCAKGEMPPEKKRDISFYTPMLNSAKDFERAEQKMGELKILTSSQKYEMRYALFDNGKFYYEVANLGNGTGEWRFRDGFINLFSSRAFFNVDIDFSAAKAEGDSLEMRFIDRFGNNIVGVQYREPSASRPLKKLTIPGNQRL